MKITLIIIIAMIAEAVWETLKMIWQDGKVSIDKIGALVVSLVLAFSVRLNIFELFGVQMYIPMLGTFLTGVLISRGSNFVHDILASIQNIYEE